MSERLAPRSRTETRAAVIEGLLREKRLFRQEIASETRLTEASVSRILTELRGAGIIAEERVSAPYVGGPTARITLSKDISIIGIELANSRLSVGLGNLDGDLDYVERQPVPHGLDQDGFERLFAASMAELSRWMGGRGRAVRQAAVSIPGLTPLRTGAEGNPILPWNMARLRDFLAHAVGDVPLAMTNAVIAQAAFHRYRTNAAYPPAGDHLFLFVGHGVAGVIVDEGAPVDTFRPFELGHMVVERGGAACRCGHRGCLEAYTSLPSISAVLGLPEDEILRRGDLFLHSIPLGPDQRAELRQRLRLLGLGLGNALNLARLPAVVICGWPSLLSPEDRAEIATGIDESLFGGLGANGPKVHFIPPAIGNDPRAALAFAAHAFARSGGQEIEVALPPAAAA